MQWQTLVRPQRHDEHRGKQVPVFPSDSHRSMTEHWPPGMLGLLGTTTLQNPRASRGFFRCAGSHQSPRRIAVAASLFVPEGRRRKLAGGKPASAGAAPGCRVQRDLPQRGIGEAFWAVCRRGPVGPSAVVRRPGPFLRCPAGARSHSSPLLPGAASAADWPPANFLGRPSGTGTGRPRPDHGKAPAREWRSQVVRLRLRRAVFIASRWFTCLGWSEWLRLNRNYAVGARASSPLRPSARRKGRVGRVREMVTEQRTGGVAPMQRAAGSPLEPAGSRRSFRLNSYG